MDAHLIFWPVLVQVATTLGVFLVLGGRKRAAIGAGEVDRKAAALRPDAWPEPVIKASNNLRNQTEAPVLFYVLCLVVWALEAVSVLALVFAWLFAASRVAHAYVHVTSNYVPLRFRFFLVGIAALFGLLGVAATSLLAS